MERTHKYVVKLVTVWLYVADCRQLAEGLPLTDPAWIDTAFVRQ